MSLEETVLQVFVGDPRASAFVDQVKYGANFGLPPDSHHDFSDEDDHRATLWQQARGRKLTNMCRAGVPEYFRGGVWNRVMSPTLPTAGTPGHKLQQERVWLRVLDKVIPQCEDLSQVPSYGAEPSFQDYPLSKEGDLAARRILIAVKHMLAVEWAPFLLDIVPMLLVYMPEACVYAMVEELWQERGIFFPVSLREQEVWMMTFRDMVYFYHPKTGEAMEECGADSDDLLKPLFQRLLVPLLPFRYVVMVWDAWLCEGNKVLFRYSLALVAFFKHRLKKLHLSKGQGKEWWDNIRTWTHDPSFSFDALRKVAFSISRGRFRPLSWKLLESCHDRNETAQKEKWAKEGGGRGVGTNLQMEQKRDESQPFFWPPFQLTPTFPPPVLLADVPSRTKIVGWVPEMLRHKRLRAVFTTEIHGNSLDMLYSHCRTVSPSLLLVEAANGAVFGAYCASPWQPNQSAFGNGQCFLFRLGPGAGKAFRWSPSTSAPPATGGGGGEQKTEEGGAAAPKDVTVTMSRKGSSENLSASQRGRAEAAAAAGGGGGGALEELSSASRRGLTEIVNASKHRKKGLQHDGGGQAGGGGSIPHVSRHEPKGAKGGGLLQSLSKHGGGMASSSSSSRHKRKATEEGLLSSSSAKSRAAATNDSFMMATREWLAMGVSSSGKCGLKLFEDLTRGCSDTTETYRNERMAGKNRPEFDVACVEVYAFE